MAKAFVIEVGTQVAVNNMDNGQLYNVTEIKGMNYKLEYLSGGTVYQAGWMDKDYLRKPTAKQVKFHELSK